MARELDVDEVDMELGVGVGVGAGVAEVEALLSTWFIEAARLFNGGGGGSGAKLTKSCIRSLAPLAPFRRESSLVSSFSAGFRSSTGLPFVCVWIA